MRRGSSWLFSVGLFSSVLVALGVGCSETGTTTPDGGAEADSGQPVTEAGAPDTSAPDAGGPDAGCTGACRTLALGATYGAVTASFERAQFGRFRLPDQLEIRFGQRTEQLLRRHTHTSD